MVRKHGSLVHDEEINEAGWIAARGAGVGAAKVRCSTSFTHKSPPLAVTIRSARHISNFQRHEERGGT